MPVWHELTKDARDAGELVLIGVIQEQHADRCRLFSQWKGFDWPILHDPVNLLRTRAVPMFVAIDEAGVVVDSNLRTSELGRFLARPVNTTQVEISAEPIRTKRFDEAVDKRSAADWLKAGDDQVLWGDINRISTAVDHYRKAVEISDNDGAAQFRLGVALRMRFDSAAADPDDFQLAVNAWGRALDIDPNHYIYRRRIQQYGPRLIKPYPFYDWIDQARAEITSRGDTPYPLVAEPVGAEIAQPSQQIRTSQATPEKPDPDGRIRRDSEGLIDVDATVVPAAIARGDAVRVHLSLRPGDSAHWNNEVDPVKVWIDVPEGWQIETPLLEAPQPTQPESQEVRHLDFELRTASETNIREIHVHVLYYVCEDQGGQCLYRRKDIRIPIRFRDWVQNSL